VQENFDQQLSFAAAASFQLKSQIEGGEVMKALGAMFLGLLNFKETFKHDDFSLRTYMHNNAMYINLYIQYFHTAPKNQFNYHCAFQPSILFHHLKTIDPKQTFHSINSNLIMI